MKERARRYNKGKLRYELIPQYAMSQLAKVYTLGAHKYSIYKDKAGNMLKGTDFPFEKAPDYEMIDDASDNWRKGLPWMDTMSSIKRHIQSWEQGEDMDELGSLHLANAAWGMMTLMEYYQIFPQGDDRPHRYLKAPRIGLDIDDVICDFISAFREKFNLDEPKNWLWTYKAKQYFDKLAEDPEELEEFYMSLKPKVDPTTLPFEPVCYITSRNVPQWITEKWIEDNGFPCAKVYTVGHDMSKVAAAKDANVEVFVDDRYDNFVELNNSGICCYLLDTPHNARYNVGNKRIYSLSEIPGV